MKITVLAENNTSDNTLQSEHGLCLYIETIEHILLIDVGFSKAFLNNANKLGIDLARVDTVIITHGHSDHGGGLKYFLSINNKAKVYIQKTAFDKYYTKIIPFFKIYIGLDSSLKDHPQIILIDGNYQIDSEISLITRPQLIYQTPLANEKLIRKSTNGYLPDNFFYEQNVIIREDVTVLISGCAHLGINNIIANVLEERPYPIDYCIGGFHLINPIGKKRTSKNYLDQLSEQLGKHGIKFYTCHCTGLPAYRYLKLHLKDKLEYITTGTKLTLTK